MIPLPIANGIYQDRSLPNSHQICKNWYVGVSETDALSQRVLYGTPGLAQKASSGVGANRGSHTKEGIPYFVNGDTLYSLTQNGNLFDLNNLGMISGSDRVSMADNGTQLMIVGNNIGYIYDETTSDWTLQTSPTGKAAWRRVAYSGSLYAACGAGSAATDNVMTSPDAETWTLRTTANSNTWTGIAYGAGVFVIVAQFGANRCESSPDGITWTTRAITGGSAYVDVIFAEGLFVALGGVISTSPDGITWTSRGAGPVGSKTALAYGNGRFVYVSSTGGAAYSDDGITWAAGDTNGSTLSWVAVTYGNGLFVAISQGTGPTPSKVMTSPDGIGWTERTIPIEGDYNGIAYGNGIFSAVGVENFSGSKVCVVSNDGINWRLAITPTGGEWQGITYAGNKFVAVGSAPTDQCVMTSTNGGDSLRVITDYDTDFTANGNPKKVRFVDSYFAVTTDEKKWIRSAQNNGLDWTATDFGSAESDPDDIQAIEIDNNNVYIIGTETIEEFDNIGGSGFGFQRSNIVHTKGTIAPDSVVFTTNGIAFLGNAKNESPAFWTLTDNQLVKISHPGIDNYLNQLSQTELEACFATYYSEAGEFFVCFTFPSRTLCYGFVSGEWHERESSGLKWRVSSVTTAYGTLWAGDVIDGRIGEMSIDIYDEYGANFVAQVSSPNFSNQGDRAFYPKIEATMEAGMGNADTPDPVLVYDYSDDGKIFVNPRSRPLGQKGQYNKRTMWRRNGSAPRYRTNRFTFTGKTKRSFLKLEAEIEGED